MDNCVEIGPSIFIFDNFIDNSEEIISAALKKAEDDGIYSATIIDKDSNIVKKEVRNTLIVDISPNFFNDVIWWLLAQKIWKCGDEYGKHHKVGFSGMENPQFLYYPQNEGFYEVHVDSDITIPRVFSSVLYLNDVEVGGETYFNKFDIAIKPVAGRLLMFPSNFAYSHGAKVPESGAKYCVVTWFTP